MKIILRYWERCGGEKCFGKWVDKEIEIFNRNISDLCSNLEVPVLQMREGDQRNSLVKDGLLENGLLYVVPYIATKDYAKIVGTIKLKVVHNQKV